MKPESFTKVSEIASEILLGIYREANKGNALNSFFENIVKIIREKANLNAGIICLCEEIPLTERSFYYFNLDDDFVRTFENNKTCKSALSDIIQSGVPFTPGPEKIHCLNKFDLNIQSLFPITIQPDISSVLIFYNNGTSLEHDDALALEDICAETGNLISKFYPDYLSKEHREFINTIDDMVFIMNSDWQIIKVNQSAADQLEYTKEELEGAFFVDFYKYENLQEIEQILTRKTGKNTIVYTIPLIAKSGNILQVEIKISQGKWNKGEAFIAICKENKTWFEERNKLLESEEKFAKIYKQSPVPIGLICYQKGFVDVNDAFLRLFELERQDIIGCLLQDTYIFDNVSVIKDLERRLFDKGELKDIEVHLRTKWGEKKIGAVSATIIELQGETFILTKIHDITERRKASDMALRIGSAVNSASDSVVISDEHFNILYLNKAFQEKFNYTIDDLNKKDGFKRLFIDQETYKELWVKVQNHQSWSGEMPMLTKSGLFIQILLRINSIFDESGKFIGAIAVHTDITELKKTEEALGESQQRFQDIAISSADMIWEMDRNFKFAFVSGKSLEMYGFLPKNMKGRSPLDLMDEIQARKFKEAFQTISNNNDYIVDYENWRKTNTGEKICVMTNALPIFNNSGRLIGYRGVDRNISVRKAAEEEKQKLMEELRNSKRSIEYKAAELTSLNKKLAESEKALKGSNSAKDHFLSIIAHDLRSPFTGLMGCSEVLYHNYNSYDDAEKKQFINEIYTSSRHVFKLLENLLNWARTQTGRIKYEPIDVRIKALTDEVVMLMDNIALKKNISLKSNTPDEIKVFVDYNMCISVLRNLVSNALKFTEPEGKVFIDCNINCKQLELSVSDTGCGMTEQELIDLFRIDRHISRKGTEGERGSGLGLILCKEFVEQNGGAISVESEPGKGSTFSFTVPLSKEFIT